jgi:hypothetical protein
MPRDYGRHRGLAQCLGPEWWSFEIPGEVAADGGK